MNQIKQPSYNPCSGYNLIQMAMALIIIGLILGSGLGLYKIYKIQQADKITTDNINNAITMLQDYQKENGAFICPAPLNVLRNDPTYGVAVNCTTDPALVALTPGNCAQGVCLEQSVRPNYVSDPATGTTTNFNATEPRVWVGAIPFRTLQLEEDTTFDGYQSRLVYAVTESMTNIATFDPRKGTIAIRDETNTPAGTVIDPDGSAAFVILSTGPSKEGAYTSEGTLEVACGVVTLDSENCNVGFQTGTTVSPNSVYISAFKATAAGAGFYDDKLNFYADTTDALWKRTTANKNNIEDLSNQNVGVNNGAPLEALDIVTNIPTSGGSIAASGAGYGAIYVNRVEDVTGANGFDPIAIAGDTTTAMKCTGNDKMMTGVENGTARCEDYQITCPTGFKMAGRNSVTNKPNCVALAATNCPLLTQSVCGATKYGSHPSPTPGMSQTVSNIDYVSSPQNCKTETYRCDGPGYSLLSQSGQCGFTPTTNSHTPIPCSTYYPTVSGMCTKWRTNSCLSPAAFGWTHNCASVCTCTPGTNPQVQTCASLGFGTSGNASRSCTVTCSPTASACTAWDTSACVCTPPAYTTRYTYSVCPGGKIRDPGAPAGIFSGPWGAAPSTNHGIAQRQDFNTTVGVCAWQNVGGPINHCICDPAPVNQSLPHPCGDPICEVPHPTDKDVFEFTNKNPVTCAPIPPSTQIYTGSCQPKLFAWTDIGPGFGPVVMTDPLVGSACSCAEMQAATVKPCRTSGGVKRKCKCQ